MKITQRKTLTMNQAELGALLKLTPEEHIINISMLKEDIIIETTNGNEQPRIEAIGYGRG